MEFQGHQGPPHHLTRCWEMLKTVTSWNKFLGHVYHSVIRAHVVSRVDPLLHLKHLPGEMVLKPGINNLKMSFIMEITDKKIIHLKVVARDFPDFCTFCLSSEQDNCIL